MNDLPNNRMHMNSTVRCMADLTMSSRTESGFPELQISATQKFRAMSGWAAL
jgi:hypothetical protein